MHTEMQFERQPFYHFMYGKAYIFKLMDAYLFFVLLL